MANYESKRIGAILLRIIVTLVLIIITAAAAVGLAASYGFVAGLIAAVIGIMIIAAVSKAMKRSGADSIGKDLIPEILGESIELTTFSASKHFDPAELRSTNALSCFTSANGGGYIDGAANGVHFVRCNVTLTDHVTDEIYNPDTGLYERQTSDAAVFSGYVMRIGHDLPQYAGVMVSSDSLDAPAISRKGEKLRSENGFSIYSSIGENIPVTLTDGMISLIKAADRPAIVTVTEKYLYIIAAAPKPQFTVGLFSSMNSNREKILEQTEELKRITEKADFIRFVK